MKAFLKHRLSNPLTAAASALMAGMSLASTPVAAEQQYLQHDNLTPYQLVGSNGRCIQAAPSAPSWNVVMAPCSDDYLQRFFVIDKPASTTAPPTDFVPQTDAFEVLTGYDTSRPSNAYIVLATELDKVPNGGFAQLGMSKAAAHVGVASTQASYRTDTYYGWRITRPSRWHYLAPEGAGFDLSIYQPSSEMKRVRFGTSGAWIYKTLPGTTSAPCIKSTFEGDDPAVGDEKYCSLWQGNNEDTPAQVVLASEQYGFTTLGDRECLTIFFTAGDCRSRGNMWTLRPTTYPK